MRKYFDTLIDAAGDPISGAAITVKHAGTATDATLYSDEGITTIANPVTTDSLGQYAFFIADGIYDFVRFKTGVINDTVTSITIIEAKAVTEVTVNDERWFVLNAKYNRLAGQWERIDTSKSAYGIQMSRVLDGIIFNRVAPGANPITWTKYSQFQLTAAGAALPATGGAILVRVDATSETVYLLQFPDGAGAVAEATWLLPPRAFSTIRILWRTTAIVGDVKWFMELREKGDADVMGSGTIIASGNVVDTAKGTTNQLNEATITVAYTPTVGKRWMLVRIKRDPDDAADTLAATAEILGVEVVL